MPMVHCECLMSVYHSMPFNLINVIWYEINPIQGTIEIKTHFFRFDCCNVYVVNNSLLAITRA